MPNPVEIVTAPVDYKAKLDNYNMKMADIGATVDLSIDWVMKECPECLARDEALRLLASARLMIQLAIITDGNGV